MEIGFSSEQITSIGLNLAGYLTAGILFLLLRSLFVQNTIKAHPVVSDGKQNSEKSERTFASSGQANKKKINNFEYIDLKGVNWRSPTDTKRFGQTSNNRPAGALPKNRFATDGPSPELTDQFKHTAGWRN